MLNLRNLRTTKEDFVQDPAHQKQQRKLADLKASVKRTIDFYFAPIWGEKPKSDYVSVADLPQSDVLEICEKILTLHDYDIEYLADVVSEDKFIFALQSVLRRPNDDTIYCLWHQIKDSLIERLSDQVQKLIDDHMIDRKMEEQESAYDNYLLSRSSHG